MTKVTNCAHKFKICATCGDFIWNLQKTFKGIKAFSSLLCDKKWTLPFCDLPVTKHLSSDSVWAFSPSCGVSAFSPHWRATGLQWKHSYITTGSQLWPKLVLILHLAIRHCVGAVVGGRAMSFNLLTSICQFGSFLADRWRRACLVKWSLLMNRRSHMGHANFFSPVWVRRCLDSSSERANLLSQPFQLQLKGFSPETKMQIIMTTHIWNPCKLHI